MKNIDFLPDWYKSGRRRQAGYSAQYIALAGLSLIMVVWSFFAVRSISKAGSELAVLRSGASAAQQQMQKFASIKSRVEDIQKKSDELEKIRPKSSIQVADMLSEMSFLIDEKIMLSEMEFKAESPPSVSADAQGGTVDSLSLRAAAMTAGRDSHLLGDVRYKGTIKGLAADAADVAELLCRLEQSSYFCLVYPNFSRNAEVKTVENSSNEAIYATEFEISCYLANYRQQLPQAALAKQPVAGR